MSFVEVTNYLFGYQLDVDEYNSVTVVRSDDIAEDLPSTAVVSITSNDNTNELELGELGSWPLGTLTFSTLGDNVYAVERLTGDPVLADHDYGQFRDADGNPFATAADTLAYLTTANTPPATDFVSVYQQALNT